MVRPKRATKRIDYSQFVDVNAGDDNDDDGDVVMEDVLETPQDDEDEFLEPEIEEEEEVAEVEDAEFEEEEDAVPKKRGRKPKPKSTETKPKKAASKKDLKTNRGLSALKDKFPKMVGHNTEKMIELVEFRSKWEAAMFQFGDDLLEVSQKVPKVELPIVEYNTLTKVDLSRKFPLDKDTITFQFGGDETQLIKPDDQVKDGDLHVLNSGTLITDMAWLPQTEDSPFQFLAVAVSNITDTATSTKFSLLSRNAYTSGFYIYKLDTSTGELTHLNTIIHEYGNCWDLKWVLSPGDLGALCAVFNDGNARILRLPHKGPDIIELKRPSLEYHLPDHMISCMDIISDRVIVGTDTGYVAEFTLDDASPSYLIPIHSSYILTIRLSTSSFDETAVSTCSADGTSALFTLDDPYMSINRTSKAKNISKISTYSRQTHSFITTDSINSAQATPIRASFISSVLATHDGSVESMASSSLHPMVLTGGSDGRIKINSIARRLLNAQKVAAANHRVMNLWELQYGKKEDTFRLVRNYSVEGASGVDTGFLNVYPTCVSFGSVCWNENLGKGEWFAAGTTSGLVFVDKI